MKFIFKIYIQISLYISTQSVTDINYFSLIDSWLQVLFITYIKWLVFETSLNVGCITAMYGIL